MICLKNTFVVVVLWIKFFAKVLLEDRVKVCLQGGKWGIIDLLFSLVRILSFFGLGDKFSNCRFRNSVLSSLKRSL